jgi:hypothetical protein
VEVVPCKYDLVSPLDGGRFAVCIDGKWGYLGPQEREITPCVYDAVSEFSKEGVAVVKVGEKRALVDLNGKMLCEPIYDRISPFENGYAAVILEGKCGYVHKCGECVILEK